MNNMLMFNVLFFVFWLNSLPVSVIISHLKIIFKIHGRKEKILKILLL